ncbi:MAG: hypothetical protein O3C43_05690 [Verrucomicrobia bacterium]|nr:hypothetical protein [Verrucomicrobiota bacterium]MDA1065976.1 hypothetical protein [Verrucomicrobiota bacterium]
MYLRATTARWANALAYKVTGDEDNARKLLTELRDQYLAGVRRFNFNNYNESQLAITYAALGDEDKSAEIFDELLQGQTGGRPDYKLDIEVDRAIAMAWLGKKDEAVAELDRLIKEPSMLNVHFMRHCLDFWPLRDHPGFQAILNDPANSQPLPPDKL